MIHYYFSFAYSFSWVAWHFDKASSSLSWRSNFRDCWCWKYYRYLYWGWERSHHCISDNMDVTNLLLSIPTKDSVKYSILSFTNSETSELNYNTVSLIHRLMIPLSLLSFVVIFGRSCTYFCVRKLMTFLLTSSCLTSSSSSQTVSEFVIQNDTICGKHHG